MGEREIPKRKRRKRYSDKHPARNPLEHISANDVQEAVEEMDRLQKAFENLQDAFARNHPQKESDLIEDTEAPPPFAQFDEDVTTPNLENFNNEVTPAEVTPPVTLHESDKGIDVEESKKTEDQNEDPEQSQADDNDEEKKEDDDENNEKNDKEEESKEDSGKSEGDQKDGKESDVENEEENVEADEKKNKEGYKESGENDAENEDSKDGEQNANENDDD